MMKYLLIVCICLAGAGAGATLGKDETCLTQNEETQNLMTNTSEIAEFGIELFKDLFPYNTTQNFFFSPFSIWSALTLAYFGSVGNTEAELRKVLRVQSKASALHLWSSFDLMYEMRQKNKSSGFTLKVANRAYFDSTVELKSCIEELLDKEIRKMDFMKEPQKSADSINEWVSDVTKNRIPSIVNAGDLANANMALVNAAFFKGTWLYQFKPSQTEKKIFYTSEDDFTFVDMMTQKGNFRHGVSEELGAHLLELPYTGESVSMFILLPPFLTGAQGFDSMVEKLNGSTLERAMQETWRNQIEVTIPKFKLEQDIGNELMKSLMNMGINDLFDGSKSNLTDFSPQGGLSVGKTIHKSFLEINEEGTEAAAATALISFRVARPVGPQKFVCNHPFLFVIYDNLGKNILFMGAYKKPMKV